jgi:hypothetical protein
MSSKTQPPFFTTRGTSSGLPAARSSDRHSDDPFADNALRGSTTAIRPAARAMKCQNRHANALYVSGPPVPDPSEAS